MLDLMTDSALQLPIFEQENFGRFTIVTRLTADAMHKNEQPNTYSL